MVLAVKEAPQEDLEELLATAWSAQQAQVGVPAGQAEAQAAPDSEKTSRTEGEPK